MDKEAEKARKKAEKDAKFAAKKAAAAAKKAGTDDSKKTAKKDKPEKKEKAPEVVAYEVKTAKGDKKCTTCELPKGFSIIKFTSKTQ